MDYFSIVTNGGISAINSAVLENKQIKIVKFAVGDGGGYSYSPTPELTALKNQLWTGDVVSMKKDPENDNVLSFTTIIPSDVGGFTIREIGLLTDDGVLLAIANTPDLPKVDMENGVTSELEIVMEIAVSHSELIDITINPSIVFATKEDLQTHTHNGMDSSKIRYDDIEGLSDFMNYINTDIVKAVSGVSHDLLDVIFQLTLQDLIDTNDIKQVVVDEIQSQDDVIVLSGKFGENKVYI